MRNRSIAFIILIIIFALLVTTHFDVHDNDSNFVNIGYLPSDHDSALFVAQAKNWFKDNNISVNLFEFSNGGNLMVAMASGHIDIGYVGITPVMSSISKGIPVKIVSSVQNEGSGIVASNDSNIESISDLKGKK